MKVRTPARPAVAAMALAALAITVLSALPAGAASRGVSVGDNFYSPAGVTVTAGTTVVWSNGGQSPHTVTANGGEFDSSPSCPTDLSACLQPGHTYSHTFSSVGTFPYHCKIHGLAMSGTITVVSASGTPPAGGGSSLPGESPLPNTGPGRATIPFAVAGVVLLLGGVAALLRSRRRA
jgi:LPXTG-motif cell wall-anchored protein